MAYLITYLPANPSQRNEELINQVKQYNTWAILNATNYIVKASNVNAVTLRDEMSQHLRPKDKLLVTKLTGAGAWRGFGLDMSEWLKKHL